MNDTPNTDTRRFDIGTILSVMKGRLLCDVGNLYELCDWMSGEANMTHQLPRVSRECKGPLAEQFPDLAQIDVQAPTITSEAEGRAFLASLEAQYGTHRDVRPLAAADHTSIDPLAEIAMMRPDLPVIPVHLPPEARS